MIGGIDDASENIRTERDAFGGVEHPSPRVEIGMLRRKDDRTARGGAPGTASPVVLSGPAYLKDHKAASRPPLESASEKYSVTEGPLNWPWLRPRML